MAKTVQDLRALGFKDAPTQIPKRLITSVYGLEKSGKTHFALTAPEPIVYFDIDLGSEGVVEKFKRAGREILVWEVRVPKGEKQDIYESMWAEAKLRLTQAFSLGKGTVVIDTATEEYELNRLARFGKLTQVLPHNYVQVNTEWREVLRQAFDSGMNAIFIHKMKSKYVQNVRTSEYEISGFGEMGYLVQCNLRCSRQDFADGKQSYFALRVDDCRHNPAINGLQMLGDAINFSALVEMVHASIATR